MAKKTKEQLVNEGKTLNSDITGIRSKGEHNFAIYLADDGVVALFDKVKSAEALRTAAKKTDGATSKGAVGTVTVEGKDILLKCAEGESPPPKLGKATKKYLKERGLAFKVVLVDSTGAMLEADDGDDEPPIDPKAKGAPLDETSVAKPSATPNPDNGVKDKLEKAFEKIRVHLIEALKAAPVDYQPKLKDPALAYSNAMKAQDYEAALKTLGEVRAAIVKAPTTERLTTQLAEKDDPAKLAGMADLLDNILKRAKSEKDFDGKAKPLMKEMRAALKAAQSRTPPPTTEELKVIGAMKTKLDNQFLEYLKGEGHGPQRHEGGVTKKQLSDRVMFKFDPMTGTKDDGVHAGKEHKCGKDATRITDPGVYVDADELVRGRTEFTNAKVEAVNKGEGRFEVELPIATVLGTEYKKFVEGQRNTGSNKYPAGPADIDFTDGTVTAVYEVDGTGEMTLLTMYPNPKP